MLFPISGTIVVVDDEEDSITSERSGPRYPRPQRPTTGPRLARGTYEIDFDDLDTEVHVALPRRPTSATAAASRSVVIPSGSYRIARSR